MRPFLGLCVFCGTLAVLVAATTYRDEPQWPRQWHLHDITERDEYWMRTAVISDYMAVQTAWKFAANGSGVRIAIVDDGLDHTHPEFARSYDAAHSFDFNDNDADPEPLSIDVHGTQAAGLAVGRANGVCGMGVAPEASVVGIRLIARAVSDLVEADALAFNREDIDVYSNSWGPPDDGVHLEGPGPLVAAAMHDAVTHGRHGLGSVYVWAAGNGRQSLDSCSYDGFANSRLVITVGAVDYFARAAYYSEWCPTMLVVAPSSGFNGPADRQHISSTLPGGLCSDSFGGTSAAAPMVAGVVALVLQARPALTWRDVQMIIAFSASQNDRTHASWKTNGAGIRVSHAYGFGMVNAMAAVRLARVWPLLSASESLEVQYDVDALPRVLGNQVLAPAEEFLFEVDSPLIVEFVELVFSASHTCRGDLEVLLYSPAGTQSQLALAHYDTNPNYNSWRFGTRLVMGEHAAGTWRLRVRDAIPNHHMGTVDELSLRVWGHRSL